MYIYIKYSSFGNFGWYIPKKAKRNLKKPKIYGKITDEKSFARTKNESFKHY